MTDTRTCPLGNCHNELVDLPICPTHRDQLARALNGGLARLYVELNLALRPGRTGTDSGDTRPPQPQPLTIPISTAARTAQQHMLTHILTAEADLRHACGWTPAPQRGREGPTLVGACTVLHAHLDTLLLLPHAVPLAADLLALIGQARYAAGKTGGQTPNRLHVPCPHCGAHALLRANGTDLIACAHCASTVSADHLDLLLNPPHHYEEAA